MPRIPKTRRLGALDQTGHALLIRQPLPRPKRGQVLLRVHASMISPGTELGQAKAARAQGATKPGAPRPFGYQNAGVVIALGAGVTQFAPGDRVACFGAGYAYITDYAVIPQNLCCKIPGRVSFAEASGTNVYLTSLQVLRRTGSELGANFLVVGLGIVGQVAAQLAKLAGMFVMGWDTLPGRLKAAKICGIDAVSRVGRADLAEAARKFTRGRGFDKAVVAYGGDATDTLQQVAAVMKCRPDGHAVGELAVVGGISAQVSMPVDFGNLNILPCSRTGPGYHDHEWEHGRRDYPDVLLRWTTRSNMELILRLIAEKRVDLKPLITHKFPIDSVDDAVAAHIEAPDNTIGTVIVI